MNKHSTTAYEDQKGFWIRRIYFTYDYNIDEQLSTRFRLEAAGNDFKDGESKMSPFVKDAYLLWKLAGQNFYVGLSGAPTFDVVESHWGLRPVEKSPEDLWKFGSSRSFGLAMKGSFSDGLLGYHLMLGSREGEKSDMNKGKKVFFSLTSSPIKELLLEAYMDYEHDTKDYTTHLFAGYKTESFRMGGQFARTRQVDALKGSYNFVSCYGAFKFMEQWQAFARVDVLSDKGLGDQAYLRISKSAKPTLYLAGVDYEIMKSAHVMPNIEFVKYDDSSVNSDLITRLTFSWVF
ncbi:MAG: hypothetical protein HY072_10330 [Deltaproteobacteria bacterium]|nr:hypothetical protein [Deltaproteobacteria bacterium]